MEEQTRLQNQQQNLDNEIERSGGNKHVITKCGHFHHDREGSPHLDKMSRICKRAGLGSFPFARPCVLPVPRSGCYVVKMNGTVQTIL